MKAFLVALAAVCTSVAAPSARADEPAKQGVAIRDRWKAGQVVTRAIHDRQTQKTEVKAGTESQSSVEETVVDAEYVIRCDEAGPDGSIGKGVVHFLAWTRQAGDAKDASLQGVTVDVRGGASHSWTARPGARAPSPIAAKWLDSTYGAEADDDKQGVLEPAAPVAVGESWKPDLAKVVALVGNGLEVDVEKSSVVATLEKVEGGVATVAVAFDLATKAFPTQFGPSPWTKGGALKLDVRVTHRVDGSPEGGHSAHKGGLAGSVVVQGATVGLDFTGESTQDTKAGGTIPEPAAGGAK